MTPDFPLPAIARLIVFLLAPAFLLASCGDDVKVSDITVVRAYFVRCASAMAFSGCQKPRYRAGSEDLTVIISTHEVRRENQFNTFHDCKVYAPRNWSCLDTTNHVVAMLDGAMIWDERKEANQIAVPKREYCLTNEFEGGKTGLFNRITCLF